MDILLKHTESTDYLPSPLTTKTRCRVSVRCLCFVVCMLGLCILCMLGLCILCMLGIWWPVLGYHITTTLHLTFDPHHCLTSIVTRLLCTSPNTAMLLALPCIVPFSVILCFLYSCIVPHRYTLSLSHLHCPCHISTVLVTAPLSLSQLHSPCHSSTVLVTAPLSLSQLHCPCHSSTAVSPLSLFTLCCPLQYTVHYY